MDTKSKPFEGDAMTPELPHIVAPPTCHVKDSEGSGTSGARSTSSDSTAPLLPYHPITHTTPVLVPILRRTARMAVRVPPVMSHGLSAEESLDSNSESEDIEDEGPTAEDEDPTAGDEGLAAGVEGPSVDDESYGLDGERYGLDDESCGINDEGRGIESDRLGLGEEEVVPEGQQRVVLITDPEDGMIYIDVPVYPPPELPVQTPPLPEWTSGSLLISPSLSIVPLPVSSPMILLTIPSPIATLTATIPVDEDQFIEVGAQLELYRGILQDHT
nr:hypothetical protein [Tanacetum cinerariifolium]